MVAYETPNLRDMGSSPVIPARDSNSNSRVCKTAGNAPSRVRILSLSIRGEISKLVKGGGPTKRISLSTCGGTWQTHGFERPEIEKIVRVQVPLSGLSSSGGTGRLSCFRGSRRKTSQFESGEED